MCSQHISMQECRAVSLTPPPTTLQASLSESPDEAAVRPHGSHLSWALGTDQSLEGCQDAASHCQEGRRRRICRSDTCNLRDLLTAETLQDMKVNVGCSPGERKSSVYFYLLALQRLQ